MKKYVHNALKTILSLIIIMPILGTLGIFPAPTREMYQSDVAFQFVSLLMNGASYIGIVNAIVCVITLGALWTKREALGALVLLPLSVHIVLFHAFLDGGLFVAGAMMGNALLALNAYFLYKNKTVYQTLFEHTA